jgi:hypothetical protein
MAVLAEAHYLMLPQVQEASQRASSKCCDGHDDTVSPNTKDAVPMAAMDHRDV